MEKITLDHASHLIRLGRAGYYSVFANPPIAHPRQTAVNVGNDWYLCTADEITITADAGSIDTANFKARLHTVDVKEGHPLADLIRADMELHGKAPGVLADMIERARHNAADARKENPA